jgi:hypothetical protein
VEPVPEVPNSSGTARNRRNHRNGCSFGTRWKPPSGCSLNSPLLSNRAHTAKPLLLFTCARLVAAFADFGRSLAALATVRYSRSFRSTEVVFSKTLERAPHGAH